MLSKDSTKLVYSIFEILNLTSDHAEAYVSLLNRGKSTTTTLARYCDIPRTTLYPLLDELVLWNLVTKIDERNKAFYQCTDPFTLIELIDHHKNRCDSILYTLKREISAFENEFNKHKETLEDEAYTADEITEDKISKLLIGAKEIRVIINTKDPEQLFILDSILDLLESPGVVIKELILNSTSEYVKERSTSPSIKLRSSSSHHSTSPIASTVKFISDIVVISMTKEMVNVAQDPDMVAMEAEIFDILWKGMK